MNTNSQVPDKCDFCGLRVYYEHTHAQRLSGQSIDSDYVKLRELSNLGVIQDVPPRKMNVVIGSDAPDSTSICAINSRAWTNRNKKCRYWTLRIKDATVADHLAVYHSQRNHKIAVIFSIAAIIASVITAILTQK